ncbi:hypothetical protein LJC42_06630 [Eubacteriales bacterium OttesenSCG-928-K08]|nr:hypothetical protein [Eubacteriales bacterium OttesenSCG-928-K08]
MKIDLKSMKNKPQANNNAASEAAAIDPNLLRELEGKAEQFRGKDEKELIDEVRRMGLRERAAGNLDDNKLDSIAGMLSPMLNAEQQQQMQSLLKQLKGI